MKSNRHRVVWVTILSAITLGSFGCGRTTPTITGIRPVDSQPVPNDHLQRIDHLTQALLALDPGVSENEARGVAQSAVTHAALLGRRYRVVRPPQLHNILVKLGWKQRGLCYHWTEDLLKHLKELNLSQLHLQRIVAHRGSDLREHHSVIVTTRKKPFQEGIVLDGWRNSGKLFWSPVGEDRYPWVPLDDAASSKNGTDAR